MCHCAIMICPSGEILAFKEFRTKLEIRSYVCSAGCPNICNAINNQQILEFVFNLPNTAVPWNW